jgi:uncharacterized membrane protein YfcA
MRCAAKDGAKAARWPDVTLLLVALLGVAIGFATGLLGAGPSIFTVLVLMHVAGLDLRSAVTTSLVVVACTSTFGLVSYASKRMVHWQAGLALSAVSAIGAFLGGRLSLAIPQNVLMAIFILAMVVAALALAKRPRPAVSDRPFAERLPAVSVAGALVGLLTGTVGLGGGFAIVPLLVFLARDSMHSAVATSLFVIATNTLAGLAGHLPHPAIRWPLALLLAPTASVGCLGGAAVGRRIDAVLLRRAFALLMIIAAAVQLGSSVRG